MNDIHYFMHAQTTCQVISDAHEVQAHSSEDISVSVQGAEACAKAGQALGLEMQLIRLQAIDELGPLAENLQPGDADAIGRDITQRKKLESQL